ncbi:MAG TPA: PHP domain-containing protein, partial [Lachnospiraceae bacterium]|nr:PHP domain-containing protein [Lachnospiraceae bacterium]
LYVNQESAGFSDYLKEFQSTRELRNKKMCARLREHGIDITPEELKKEFPGAVITRGLYAKYMLKNGYVKSMKEAFDRYIGDHAPCYVPREKITPEQAVGFIKSAGGLSILAHPTLYHMSRTRLETLVGRLKEAGLDGIEAKYTTYSISEEREMKEIAAKFGLAISGGSDFHGTTKPDTDLGVGYGRLYIDDSVLENLKKIR